MKTEFELDGVSIHNHVNNKPWVGHIRIIGQKPKHKPYVSMTISYQRQSMSGFIPDKDLERFAVNILKAIKSKRLK